MRRHFRGLWRNPDFLKLWLAKTISDFGTMISGAALSFTAILALKATPAQLGLLMVAGLLPKFLASLFAGVWVDRLPRRPLMIIADLGRAALLATIPTAALMGRLRIEQLYVVAFLTGLLTILSDIAERSYLPTLIRPHELVEGNSKLTATASVAEFSAFSLAGWLVQWLTGPIAVLIDAVSFLFSALFLGAIRKPESIPPVDDAEGPPNVRKELAEGLNAVLRTPILRALTVVALIQGVSSGIIGAVIVAFMARDLGFKPGILGMIWAVGGAMSLLGALAAGPLMSRVGMGRSLALGLLFAGGGVFIVPLAHGATLLAGAILAANQILSDPGWTVYNINQVSLRQTLTPDRLQGRVNAAFEFVDLGATLLGALLGGFSGERLGLRGTLFIGASGLFLACLWILLSPVRRVQGLPSMEEATDAQNERPLLSEAAA